jgi:hypothetical protein
MERGGCLEFTPRSTLRVTHFKLKGMHGIFVTSQFR